MGHSAGLHTLSLFSPHRVDAASWEIWLPSSHFLSQATTISGSLDEVLSCFDHVNFALDCFCLPRFKVKGRPPPSLPRFTNHLD